MGDFHRDGYALADLVLAQGRCEEIAASLPAVTGAARGGVRNLIEHPTVLRLLSDARFGRAVSAVVDRELVAVKATLFDKTEDANWRVQWHQDLMIAAREHVTVPGYGAWTTKAGVPHVEAPADVLAQMVAVRVHLDDCGSDNGPLLVIPGSHRRGRLPEDSLAEVVARGPLVELSVPQGALLFVRPLLVHASSAARVPGHRRVLHIELAPRDAIAPLEWHSRVPLALI